MKTKNQHTKIEKLLLEAARMFNSTLEYEELVQMVLKLVSTAVNSEAALLFRVDHNRSDMKIRFMKCSDCCMKTFFLEIGQGVVGWVTKFREPVIINDPRNDPRVEPQIEQIGQITARSIISVPLIGKGQMIGVVEAINKIDGEFSETDLDILTGLNNQIAVAIDNAHLYREIKREALEKDLLYQVGKKLSGSLDLDEVMREILDTLKQVVSYDAGGIFLADPSEGNIKSLYTVGYDPVRDAQMQVKIGQGLIGHVASMGEPVIVHDVSKDTRYVDAKARTLDEAWINLMLNQFHDILPGSSIHRVYEETEAILGEVYRSAQHTARAAAASPTTTGRLSTSLKRIIFSKR